MNFDSEYFTTLLNTDLGSTVPFLSSDTTPRMAAKMALRDSIMKKFRSPVRTNDLAAAAISLFMENNVSCANYKYSHDTDELNDILCLARDKLYERFNSGPFQTSVLTLNACVQVGRAGPGASRSIGKATDFYHKMFNGPMSTTSYALYSHYIDALSSTWMMAEFNRFSLYGLTIVKGSKISTVPKNSSIDRTICTEPSLNMFYQLGAGDIIEAMLKKYHNIDISTQATINRRMAKTGSLLGNLSTIDLRSASDTISLALLDFLLPKNVMAVLQIIRSKVTDVNGTEVELGMISTMGNGFTFPLQTLIFATIIESVYEMRGITPHIGRHKRHCSDTYSRLDTMRNYSVFGDDLIVTSQLYDLTCRVLGRCGFTVNDLKSFSVGPFRESCGHDYFLGHDIRGVYLQEATHVTHIYSIFNRLFRWAVRHDTPLNLTLCYLKGLVVFQPVPWDASDDEGIKWPSSLLTNIKSDGNGAQFYRAMIPKPYEIVIKDDKLINPSGAIISLIGGFIRNNTVNRRVSLPQYKVIKRKTPSWDYVPYAGLTIQQCTDYAKQLA